MIDKNLFAKGKIIFDSCEAFLHWAKNQPDKNLWHTETVLQVTYGQILLDVEWNSRFRKFVIHVVEIEENAWWGDFLEKRLCSDWEALWENVVACVENIETLMAQGLIDLECEIDE